MSNFDFEQFSANLLIQNNQLLAQHNLLTEQNNRLIMVNNEQNALISELLIQLTESNEPTTQDNLHKCLDDD